MKKMKYIIVGVFGLLTMSSCNNWLTVNPKMEITKDKLFKSEYGFRDALTGCYIQMKTNNAYGFELTINTTEFLVNSWDEKEDNAEKNFALHNYSNINCENRIQAIYAQLYTIITSANSILDHIEVAKNNGVFTTPGFYELVKGEALAIRAMCHLDILRLFGPVPTHTNGSLILPYVTKVDKTPTMHKNYENYCTLLLEDLGNAASIMKDHDPVTVFKETDEFFLTRQYRLNYYAVKALQARANLYMGHHQTAYNAALEVVNAKGEDGKEMYKLGEKADVVKKDYTLRNEHIFAIHDFNLYKKYKEQFLNGNHAKGSDKALVNGELFGNTGLDFRETDLWKVIEFEGKSIYGNTLIKYFAEDVTNNTIQDCRIPLLRIAEMYLILVETAPIAEATEYWSKFLASRSLSAIALDETNRKDFLLKEYRKEFYGEGQMFYTHKRLNSPHTEILWLSVDSKLNYVLPLPKTEIIN